MAQPWWLGHCCSLLHSFIFWGVFQLQGTKHSKAQSWDAPKANNGVTALCILTLDGNPIPVAISPS